MQAFLLPALAAAAPAIAQANRTAQSRADQSPAPFDRPGAPKGMFARAFLAASPVGKVPEILANMSALYGKAQRGPAAPIDPAGAKCVSTCEFGKK